MTSKVKVVVPSALRNGYVENSLALAPIGSAWISKGGTGESLCFSRVKPIDGFMNGSIKLGILKADQDDNVHDWFVDEAGNKAEEGTEAFLNLPDQLGKEKGKAIYG